METTGDTTEARLQQGHQPEKPEEPDPTTTLQSVKLCWCTTWYCLHHGYTFALLRFQSRWSNRCKRSACTRTGRSDKRAYPWPRSHVKSTQTYNIHQSIIINTKDWLLLLVRQEVEQEYSLDKFPEDMAGWNIAEQSAIKCKHCSNARAVNVSQASSSRHDAWAETQKCAQIIPNYSLVVAISRMLAHCLPKRLTLDTK